MPILLDDLSANVSSTLTSPTFFSSKLTGNGKRQGFLCESINPAILNPKKSVDLTDAHLPKVSMTHNGAEYYHIPMHFFPTTWYPFATSQAYDTFTAAPDIDHAVPVVKTRNREVYMQLVPYSIELVMTPPPPGSATRLKDRSIVVVYDLQICHINPSDAPKDTYHVYQSNIGQNVHMVKNPNSPHSIVIHSLVTRNIADTAHMVLDHLSQIFVQTTVDTAAWDKYFDEYSLFDEVQALATAWETDLPRHLESVFVYTDNHTHTMTESVYEKLSQLLSRLEDYKIPLQLYNQIYADIIKYYTPDVATELCKENLNLLLHNTLSKLDKDKPQLSRLPAIANKPAIDPKFSIEQRAAITTEEPLALVQSVAGSGKSSVILARIQYMVDAGVNPEDITVISFTNAAADHIKELNKDVHSMTFSLMIHKIYTENFPNHNLSSLDTLINAINIYLPRDDFAMEFSKKLIDLTRTSAHSFTDMNNFVERNYADVIRVLDTVGQTTLEMEIIICYQFIDNLIEPADVLSRYLIIDEVQDNSIFEFVYALKYVAKHKESLFIVGDASQTLYEFRSSNPRALNVMEASGVFATFKMQTNYRSNQEILDLANTTLSTIEANQFAKLRLRANSLAPVTSKSLMEKVHIDYHYVSKLSEFTNDIIPNLVKDDIMPYINDCLARNEKVAILAYKNADIRQMEELLADHYPANDILNIAPAKAFDSTVFSSYIRYFGDTIATFQLAAHPVTNDITPITHQIRTHMLQDAVLARLVKNTAKARFSIEEQINKWVDECWEELFHLQRKYSAKRMTKQELIDAITVSMLDYEIKNNRIRSSLLAKKNNDRKTDPAAENAKILLSTIHSAKGLEFDNVIILYQSDTTMNEERKRMYYVALTRAMKTEKIVAFGTGRTCLLRENYCDMINAHREAEGLDPIEF